jgi:2-C-methyl-D-erythritol 2,4-cyclodiphosphate synthase|tara:strand:- start:378 stop:866 length:489 start_codon:yes stop_codon:yes gene_type:complete
MSYKIGQGYDVHQLKANLPLILGGVNIPHSKGILAHSDGDILIHSIIDAILGACNKGDIGSIFPNNDSSKNMSGLLMLETIRHDLKIGLNIFISNIDATIILQTPKLLPYIESMKNNIAHSLEINPKFISIKATTTDYLGVIGQEKGIACLAVCLLNEGKIS